ncbi:MAG: hypothetical protein HC842_02005 [Cytophagales bacterium]|nr:hypothetical protein [Cytophagales bacterium]
MVQGNQCRRPLNDNQANGVAAISSDDNTVYLLNAYDASGKHREGISISRRTKSGWSPPENMNIKFYYQRSEFSDFNISSNGKAMILAVQRDDSYGDQDLYVSFLEDENTLTWSEPKNLGFGINSDKAEFAPFLASDGKTLFSPLTGTRVLAKAIFFIANC